MTKDEALRLALEAFGEIAWVNSYNDGDYLTCNFKSLEQAITAIKAALEAKDEPEYYGLTKDHLWMSISKEHYDRLKPEFRMACYTTPPQRKPLTDEEIWDAYMKAPVDIDCHVSDLHKFARAIESAHCITGDNNG